MRQDYVSISLEGMVLSDLRATKNPHLWVFDLEHVRGNDSAVFNCFLEAKEKPDIIKGDKVSIVNAGFYRRKDVDNIVIKGSLGSHIFVIRESQVEKVVLEDKYI